MSRKTGRKPKLNLTVSTPHQQRAEKLAELEKRSVSNLFEVLVDEEWERRHLNRVNEIPHALDRPEKKHANGTKTVRYSRSRKRTGKT